jgi:uncharacterized protein YbjT (DUF2867 family)
MQVTYYQHWTTVVHKSDLPEAAAAKINGNFLAYCSGCDWTSEAETRYFAVQDCKAHSRERGERRQRYVPPPARAAKSPIAPVYSDTVAKLLNLAVAAPDDHEAALALAKARALHVKERAA